ncbi:hypothetical protein BJY24_004131 [Nocardia transvalensis]|uniref:Minor tail protein n=1 Tax=Nocardia transvalensis TaxID=37333 RepID=A0A7W9PFJ6_9NOCA|nr:hypothetical protein [Nocardia transvalensis]MBB5915264.1 hypothetical protein [Nocardia transvalensis]
MALFYRGQAPVDMRLGDLNVLRLYLGDELIWDGTTPVLVPVPPLLGAGSVPAPDVATGTAAGLPALLGSGDAPDPAIGTGVTIPAPALGGIGIVPTPGLVTGVTISAPAATGVGSVPAPMVGETRIDLLPLLGTGAVPAPAFSGGVTAADLELIGSGEIPDPVLSTGLAIAAPALAGTGVVPIPDIVAGARRSDDFNRANGAMGANWTLGNGTQPQISSNMAAQTGSSDGFFPARYNAGQSSTDRWYVEWVVGATPTSVASGVLIRARSDWTQAVAAGCYSSGTAIATVTSATGSGSVTRASNSTTFAAGDTLRVQADGNVYTVFKNGVSIGLSWTDSGGVIGTGSNNRWGGLYVQRSSFTNSAALNSWVLADY